ncbi:MAG: uracil-DNA glycosylase [Coriobacteriia bacterium]|nr:uracil-DNA glycosylase [Coriobacteriia bacterium]
MNEQLPEIEQLGLQAADCQLCTLAARRTQVVWGDGPATARVVFVGEAPGRKEDEGGRPFIGAAGHLLDELLEAAHITRADVYITNIVKCRPPGNRDPLDEEIVACRAYLNRQLQLLHPKVIVTLGRFATHLILQTTEGISRLQGRVFERHGYKVLPLYHPAAAIYDLMKKEPLFAAAPILDELVNGAESASDTRSPVPTQQETTAPAGVGRDAPGVPPAPAEPPQPQFTQETLDIWNA